MIAARDRFRDLVPALLSLGIRPTGEPVMLTGGANNRVMRVDTEDGPIVVKQYFRHPLDPRDRLAAEFDFLEFAWGAGLRCLPRPIARDASLGIGCCSFIEGRAIDAEKLPADHVRSAIAFVDELQRLAREHRPDHLPAGAEACFSVAEHIHRIGGRVERLTRLDEDDDIAREARGYVTAGLLPVWREVRDGILEGEANLHRILPPEDRCLSPSDFGFHNALRRADGTLAFIDFEYAGWDDPAKLVCDFFCQPRIAAPVGCFDEFARAAASWTGDPAATASRIATLFPAYQVKWCCILLNAYLPQGALRRGFAHPMDGDSLDLHRREQLAAARRMLARIHSPEAASRAQGA